MYVNVVDELVDFVFDGGGAVVVFLFERLGNLYTQSVIRNLISRDFFFYPNSTQQEKKCDSSTPLTQL